MRHNDLIETVRALAASDSLRARAAAFEQACDLICQDPPGSHRGWRLLRIAVRLIRAGQANLSAPAFIRLCAMDPELGDRLQGGARRLPRDRQPAWVPLPAEVSGMRRLDAKIAEGENQIQDLLARIAAFRGRHPSPIVADAEQIDDRWTWRTDELGRFVASPGGPAAIVGVSLVAFEPDAAPELIERAQLRRAPFRDIECRLGAGVPLDGRWRLSGFPQFERGTGRFTGYWGSAIRLANAVADPAPEGRAAALFGGDQADAFATMAHEVRTPLNAILGFAQLIDTEIFGEVTPAYHDDARAIIDNAERLLRTVDDLSAASALEHRGNGDAMFDPGPLLRKAAARATSAAAARDLRIETAIATDLPDIVGDPVLLEHAVDRLLVGAISGARTRGHVLFVAQRVEQDLLRVAVSVVTAPNGAESSLAAGELLGLSLATRLAQRLAASMNGQFSEQAGLYILDLPAAKRGNLSAGYSH
jgi:hypothetical protein